MVLQDLLQDLEQDLAKLVLQEQDGSANLPMWLQKLERCPRTEGADEFDTSAGGSQDRSTEGLLKVCITM